MMRGPVENQFDNCYVMRFAPDGRCAEFTEWYMERPPRSQAVNRGNGSSDARYDS
jgi:hypothetical protein